MADGGLQAGRRRGRPFLTSYADMHAMGYDEAPARLVSALRTMIKQRFGTLTAFHTELRNCTGGPLTFAELSRQLRPQRFRNGPEKHVADAIVRVCDPAQQERVDRLWAAARAAPAAAPVEPNPSAGERVITLSHAAEEQGTTTTSLPASTQAGDAARYPYGESALAVEPKEARVSARPRRRRWIVAFGGSASVVIAAIVAAMLVLGRAHEVPVVSHLHTKALPDADSSPVGIAAVGDDTAWFTEVENNKIGRVTARAARADIEEFSATSDDIPVLHPFAIVADGNGGAWFTEGLPYDDHRPTGNRIGHIDAAGKIVTYPIPHSDAGAVGITRSSDGTVWFTEQRANQIGRLNRDGSIDEFPAARSSYPDQIVIGPDGNVWFTEFGVKKLAWMTRDGFVRAYDMGTSPVDVITRGTELWFTLIDGKKIGRLDPAHGRIQWIEVPTKGEHGPANLAEDHGHSGVWFTELSDAAVSYVSDAQPTAIGPRFLLAPGSEPVGISVGPDGTVWFTEQAGNQIGWISTS